MINVFKNEIEEVNETSLTRVKLIQSQKHLELTRYSTKI